ncbi:putative jacalin-like lectin domain superfamily [Helianthus debilis subsp. tardiflorus]
MGGSSMLGGCLVHGPWGGSFGGEWVYMPEGFTTKIKISVRYGEVIDSINFQTCFTTGETLSSSFGGKGGDRTDTVTYRLGILQWLDILIELNKKQKKKPSKKFY